MQQHPADDVTESALTQDDAARSSAFARAWRDRSARFAGGRSGHAAQALVHGHAGLVAFFALGVLLSVGAMASRGFAPPRVLDEMAYLLGADTFAHFRLTNPTHPMWRYFETFHVLLRPSYASKYPPAQSLFLALGQVTTGHPVVGLWLSFGFMCAALLWMLRAWVGDGWALGTAAACVCALAGTYWAGTFWGGAVAAGGGALVFGAGRRAVVEDDQLTRYALLTAGGLLILANSRPFEGALAVVPLAVILAAWLARGPAADRRRRLLRFALPLAVCLALGGAWMLWYNRCVTGHWFRFPYLEYQRQYDGLPLFRFQQATTPPWSPHETIRRLQAWEVQQVALLSTRGPLRGCGVVTLDYLIPARILWLGFFVLLALRDRWMLLALVTIEVAFVGMALSTWFQAHYAAPVVAPLVALFALCWQRAARIRVRQVALGRYLAVLALALWSAMGIVQLARTAEETAHRTQPDWSAVRRDMIARLTRAGGKHLILVRYGPLHSPHVEWVYNPADIDGAPVLFARDMGKGMNGPLLTYFRDRRIWRLYVDRDLGLSVPASGAADQAVQPELIEATGLRAE